MRKILTILWTASSITTVSTNIIACDNSSNKDKYQINDKGEIIYNFQINQAYIIGFTINSHIYESNIYVQKIPFSTYIFGEMSQYRTELNINENKAWTTGWYTNNLIYLKKEVI